MTALIAGFLLCVHFAYTVSMCYTGFQHVPSPQSGNQD